ncbi:cytochrome oxidase complex assembly protein 1-domain-containing protein [Dichotomocladium elegans]|nr:cytochrome oxidase complex assembly protein 1-domain-containing protein [Dichotomocladium elegans]
MLVSRILSRSRPSSAIASANRLVWAASSRRLVSHKTTTRVVERELPSASRSRKPWIIGGALVGTAVWVGVLATAMNYQRLSSSVVSGTLFTVRYDPRVIKLLGDTIDYADEWPWISGTVNHLKGEVSIAFDIAGANGERGRVRFSSVRRGQAWTTTEFTVTRKSDSQTVDLGTEQELTDQGAPSTIVS